MSNRSVWRVLIGLIVLIGCGAPQSSVDTQNAHRLIPLGDYSLSKTARFFDEIEVARWDFSDLKEIDCWTLERIDLVAEPTGTGLRLRSSSADPALFRNVEIEAQNVKAFRIYEAGLTSDTYAQLYWTGPDEAFSENKTLGVNLKDPTGALLSSYTFEVHKHPGWSGKVSKIRIDPTAIADRRLEIFSIVALDFVPNNSLIQDVSDRPWRVDINGDVRTAMLTPPGFDFQEEIKIPKYASLDFSIGLRTRAPLPVSFEVAAELQDGTEEVIFQKTLLTEDDVRWYDQHLDLSSYSGKTIQLRFRTSASEPLNLFEGFPAWANIHITTPRPKEQHRPKNVIMIVADTLRADRLSLYGNENNTSPHIDHWSTHSGVIFENTVASAPWTVPSHASLFTGLDCFSHGVNTGDPMPSSLTTMAEIFASEGYTTHAVTGGAYLTEDFGLMQGFDVVQYWRPPSGDPIDAGDDIVDGIDTALEFLETNTDRPFFLFFHTYEVHTPYRAREPFFSQFHGTSPHRLIPPVDTLALPPIREQGFVLKAALKARYDDESAPYQRIQDEDLAVVHDLYDSGIAFADCQIGRLLDRIKARDLRQDTVVLLTSDHGESLGEHDHFEHKRLGEPELLVPLIISSPDHSAHSGERVSTQVRLIDVLPTILELVNLPDPIELDGQSLVPLMKNKSSSHPQDAWSYASSSNSGLSLRRNNQLKYIFNNTVCPEIYGQQELYNLEIDPKTDSNCADSDSRASQLYSEASKQFDQRTSGVRILFSNQLDVPMEAHLKGDLVHPHRVKGFAVKTDFLEFRYNMLNIVVPPHQSLVFHLEGNPFGELYVTARFDIPSVSRTGIKHVMSLHQYNGAWQSVFDGERWLEDMNVELGTTTGIRIWIQGPQGNTTSPAIIDQESRMLLQKLGYVN